MAFWSAAVWPDSEFRRLLAECLPYRVMAAVYQPARKPGLSGADFMVQRGWYGEKWELEVYPVLSEFRPLANRLLREEGLPSIAAWLKASDRPGWARTYQSMELWFDPDGQSLISKVRSGV
ncbi:hypothetical protein TA3x_001751 [Tundrisphaera sp. TA3]|uniref:hypothetical protein n=1 Tax=Tundrisphaera sp. TA3 TaxID=3435775 RepID=UPI003EBB3A2E